MTAQFHENVASILSAEGWHESRFVDATHWIDSLKDAGFTPTVQVERFLSNFGGLKFKPPMNPNGAYRPGELSFDPSDPVCDFNLVSHWSEKFGEDFCPIGAASRRATIVIGKSGLFYLVSDIGIHHVGNTLSECLDCLVGATSKPSVALLALGET
ncbi:MAG: SUKH-3 domain-containing protein [Pirellulaceae bacterium]